MQLCLQNFSKVFPDPQSRWNIFKIWLFNETNVSYLNKNVFVISFSKTKNIKKREFFCQNLKSQKIVLLNNLVIRQLNFVINANILGIAKRPHMEDYEFSKFQQKFCKFKSKFKHYKKKVPICFIKVHNSLRGIWQLFGCVIKENCPLDKSFAYMIFWFIRNFYK